MFFKDKVEIDFIVLVFVGMFMFMFIVVFDIIGLNQLLIEKYIKDLVEKSFVVVGFDVEGLIDEFDGDIMLAVYDELNIIFVVKFKDEVCFFKNLNVVVEEGSFDQLFDCCFCFLKFKKGVFVDFIG